MYCMGYGTETRTGAADVDFTKDVLVVADVSFSKIFNRLIVKSPIALFRKIN